MRFALAAALLVSAAVSQVDAQGCCVAFEMRRVVCYRAEWREEKVQVEVQRVNYRREVTQVRVQCWVPRETEENVRRTYFTPVPRVVERDVPVCTVVPAVSFDPCTGCPYVCYVPHMTVQRVRCVEYDWRRDERDERVRVCRWVQEERMVDQVRCIPEVSQERVWTVQRTCVMVPYETYVCVPTWMPCCH